MVQPWSPPQPATVATTASPLQTLLLQFRLLLKKNWFVVKRGWALTATQVLIPLIMGLVLFTLRADDLYTEDGFNANTFAVVTPPVHYIGPLAACGPKDAADCVPLGVVFNSRLASASAAKAERSRRVTKANFFRFISNRTRPWIQHTFRAWHREAFKATPLLPPTPA